MSVGDSEVQVIEDEKYFTEEYKIWKKNTPFLYDLVMTHSLEWPSLTAQWLPVITHVDGKDYNTHRVILGTHTENAQNHLLIASVQLPIKDVQFDQSQYDADKEEYGGYGTTSGKIEIDLKINHMGEVNKARFLPQHPFVIATKSPSSDVYVFDFTKHSSKPDPNGICKPEITLKGHSQEGFGLAWSPFKTGHLISGSFDNTICYWDISATTYESSTVNANSVYYGHSDKVADVSWHEMHEDIFGSVSDDCKMMIWDTRTERRDRPSIECQHHKKEVNCLSFNPFNPYIIATGSSDKTIGLWDIRNTNSVFHSIEIDCEVFQLQWSPHYETVIGCSGSNNRVNIFNLADTNNDLSEDELKYGCSELSFSHAGHMASVSEFSWNCNEPLLACSVASDNSLHIWQPSLDL